MNETFRQTTTAMLTQWLLDHPDGKNAMRSMPSSAWEATTVEAAEEIGGLLRSYAMDVIDQYHESKRLNRFVRDALTRRGWRETNADVYQKGKVMCDLESLKDGKVTFALDKEDATWGPDQMVGAVENVLFETECKDED